MLERLVELQWPVSVVLLEVKLYKMSSLKYILCGNIVREKILTDVRYSQFYSIIADEATDAFNKEQLFICVQYWNKDFEKLEEMFLGFPNCDTGVTGEAIAESILTQLSSWRLSIDLSRSSV